MSVSGEKNTSNVEKQYRGRISAADFSLFVSRAQEIFEFQSKFVRANLDKHKEDIGICEELITDVPMYLITLQFRHFWAIIEFAIR